MNNGDMPAMACVIHANEQSKAHGFTDTNCSGLTKRERFAMAAMQGLISHYGNGWEECAGSDAATSQADMLLAALEK